VLSELGRYLEGEEDKPKEPTYSEQQEELDDK
jgi:hypothetical protein